MESILATVRTGLGLDEDFEGFDQQLIIYINAAILALVQIGVAPSSPMVVTNTEQTWTDLFGAATNLEACKAYVLISCRLGFDPPQTAALLNATKEMMKEYEWRLLVELEPEPTP